MNIAVIYTKGEKEGGAFRYSLSISLLLQKNISAKYNFLFFTTVKKNVKILKKYNLDFHYLRWTNVDRVLSLIFSSRILSSISSKLRINLESRIDRILKKFDIDLIYFLNPSDLALATDRYNYIFTMWDLCFLEHVEFPEVYMNREFERREWLYKIALRKAVKIITDSEFTKQNIVRKYGIGEERIMVFSLWPMASVNVSEPEYSRNYIDIKKKYNINGNYIFYPAQFWQHKNHIYILEGLKLLKEKYKIPLSAIFAGSDKGNLRFILKKAKELGVGNQVYYIGFVEDKELYYLYTQALALVMPTYFGPTNIPPLEAFAVGCPVLYSDLPGLREQVEGSALLLDLSNPDSLCKGLLEILKNTPEISNMIEKGRKIIESLKKEDSWGKLEGIFDNYTIKSKCWK